LFILVEHTLISRLHAAASIRPSPFSTRRQRESTHRAASRARSCSGQKHEFKRRMLHGGVFRCYSLLPPTVPSIRPDAHPLVLRLLFFFFCGYRLLFMELSTLFLRPWRDQLPFVRRWGFALHARSAMIS
jgi:hypothetical protein